MWGEERQKADTKKNTIRKKPLFGPKRVCHDFQETRRGEIPDENENKARAGSGNLLDKSVPWWNKNEVTLRRDGTWHDRNLNQYVLSRSLTAGYLMNDRRLA